LYDKGDVLAFGCIIIEIYNQKRPWSEYSINQKEDFQKAITGGLSPSIHVQFEPKLKELLEKCFIFDRAKRPDTSQLLLERFFIEEISPSLSSEEYTNKAASIIIKGFHNNRSYGINPKNRIRE